MKSMPRFLQREWELLLCVLAAVVLVCYLGSWLLGGRVEEPAAGGSRLTEAPSILGPGAFAFLQDAAPAPVSARDPFAPSATGPAAPRASERPSRRDPPKAPAPAPPPPAPTPAAVPEPAPAAPVPTAPQAPSAVAATPRLGVCDLRYAFSSVNRSGRPVALLELQDPARPGSAPVARSVSAGDVVFGLRVQSFTDEALILVDAAGRRHSVAFGGVRRVAVEAGGQP